MKQSTVTKKPLLTLAALTMVIIGLEFSSITTFFGSSSSFAAVLITILLIALPASLAFGLYFWLRKQKYGKSSEIASTVVVSLGLTFGSVLSQLAIFVWQKSTGATIGLEVSPDLFTVAALGGIFITLVLNFIFSMFGSAVARILYTRNHSVIVE